MSPSTSVSAPAMLSVTPKQQAVLERIEDYFFASPDVYARTRLVREMKAGQPITKFAYAPACGCSPTCASGSKCPNWQPLPISESVILNHLRARSVAPQPHTIGTYTLDPQAHVRWICLDGDAHGASEEDRARNDRLARRTLGTVSAVASRLNLPHYLEHSGSGYHLWIFCQTTARVAHRAGRALVQMARQDSLDILVPLEVFPKQSVHVGDRFGNLVKLPWGLHYNGRRTQFLDLATWQPLPDQFYGPGLMSWQRADEGALLRLSERYEAPQPAGLPMAPQSQAGLHLGPPCMANLFGARLDEGEGRNNALFALVQRLRRAGFVEQAAAMPLIELWNAQQKAPLDDRELHGTVASAYRSRFSYGCETDAMEPYCEREYCPIYNAQMARSAPLSASDGPSSVRRPLPQQQWSFRA